jgi:hypothetical protein
MSPTAKYVSSLLRNSALRLNRYDFLLHSNPNDIFILVWPHAYKRVAGMIPLLRAHGFRSFHVLNDIREIYFFFPRRPRASRRAA